MNDKLQFTALHLLCANPSFTGDMITAYLELALDAALMLNNIKQTPLHMLCLAPFFSNDTGDAMRAYLADNKGKKATCAMGGKGRTPFGLLLFGKSFDDMPFLGKFFRFDGMVV